MSAPLSIAQSSTALATMSACERVVTQSAESSQAAEPPCFFRYLSAVTPAKVCSPYPCARGEYEAQAGMTDDALLEDCEGREVPPASAAQSLHTTRVLMGGLVCVVCAGGDGAADGAAAGVPPY